MVCFGNERNGWEKLLTDLAVDLGGAFFGDCVSVHIQRHQLPWSLAAAVCGGASDTVCICVLYCPRACDVSELWAFWGFHSSSAFLSERECGRRNLQQLPAFFPSFFFFKPRRNVTHERDWLKWLESSPRKVRMTISPKQRFERKSNKSGMFSRSITENQMVSTFKMKNLLKICSHVTNVTKEENMTSCANWKGQFPFVN